MTSSAMYGRKKQLLDSYNASGELPSSHQSVDMTALNPNQSLTEQIAQHRRRTPVRVSPDAVQPSSRLDLEVDGRCGRVVASSPSPARGPRRSRDPAAAADEPPKPAATRPPRSPDPGALGQAAFPPGIDPLAARLALQHQLGLFPHPALHPPPPSFLLPPDSGVTQHLELLYRVKYPGYPVPPPWLLYQYQDELVRDAALLQQQQQHQSTSERLDHGLRERDRVDNDRSAVKDRQERYRLHTALCFRHSCRTVTV